MSEEKNKILVHMSYPLCPICHSNLKPTGKEWIAFVQCTNYETCGKWWDKQELLGAYISGMCGPYISNDLIRRWWNEFIEQMKKQNQAKIDE